MSVNHTPDKDRIPQNLGPLDWLEIRHDLPLIEALPDMPNRALVLVPVYKDVMGNDTQWDYEINVILWDGAVYISEESREPWGWDWEDVDYYLPLY